MVSESKEGAANSGKLWRGLKAYLDLVIQQGLTAVIIAGTVIALVILHIGAGAASSEELEPRGIPVETVTAERSSSYTVERRYAAVIEAAKAADVGFEVGGRVVEVLAEIGDAVEAGDALGSLDRSRLNDRSTSLEASIAETEALLVRARAAYDRQSGLAAENATSQAALEAAKAELGAAVAVKQRLAAELRTAQTNVRDTVLRAPFTGTVTERRFDVGDVLAAGAPVMRLVQSSSREARASVPVSVLSSIAPGDDVSLIWNRKRSSGLVKSVVPEVDARTRSATLVIALPGDMKPVIGETVTLLLHQEIEGEGYWVSVQALVADLKGLFAVQVAQPIADNAMVIARAPVEILYTDGKRAFVSGTLEDGDLIVMQGTNRVVPGQRVTLARAKGPEPLQ